MINLLLGAPGAGKSYEAVVFHVLPALERGRKVITNLPLVVEEFAKLDPAFPALIELRQQTLAERPEVDMAEARRKWETLGVAHKPSYWNNAAFSHPEDFGDPWRHPSEGFGPLYIIDECHIPLPSKGTPIKVEEWFSLHRHETADVLLITQSYGKVNRAVIDLVQACYRVRKNIAFGSPNSYVRKVQDGVRGEVVNTTIRKYQKPYFKFYQSHTRGGGSELGAQDIKPIWRHWTFMGAALLLGFFLILLATGKFKAPWSKPDAKPAHVSKPVPSESIPIQIRQEPLKPGERVILPPEANGVPPRRLAPGEEPTGFTAPKAPPVAASAPLSSSASPARVGFGPLEMRQLHFAGAVTSSGTGRVRSLFVLSQNGQRVSTMTGDELARAGYVVEILNDCMAQITYGTESRFAICDSPQVSVAIAGGSSGSGVGSGGTPLAGGDPSHARDEVLRHCLTFP